eukprot:5852200-Pyramimonas_sp.AAC.1
MGVETAMADMLAAIREMEEQHEKMPQAPTTLAKTVNKSFGNLSMRCEQRLSLAEENIKQPEKRTNRLHQQ